MFIDLFFFLPCLFCFALVPCLFPRVLVSFHSKLTGFDSNSYYNGNRRRTTEKKSGEVSQGTQRTDEKGTLSVKLLAGYVIPQPSTLSTVLCVLLLQGEPLTWEDALRQVRARFHVLYANFDTGADNSKYSVLVLLFMTLFPSCFGALCFAEGELEVINLFNQLIALEKPPNKMIVSEPLGPQAANAFCTALGLMVSPFFQSLCFWNADVRDQGAQGIASCLAFIPQVYKLEILNSGVGEAGAGHISTMLSHRNLSHLTILRLDHNQIGTKGVEYIAKGLHFNTNLKHLSLSHCGIDEHGGVFVAKIMKNKASALKSLNLEHNELREKGIWNICDGITDNRVITTLNLAYNNFKFESVVDILTKAIASNPILTNIDLDGNLIEGKFVFFFCASNCFLRCVLLSCHNLFLEARCV